MPRATAECVLYQTALDGDRSGPIRVKAKQNIKIRLILLQEWVGVARSGPIPTAQEVPISVTPETKGQTR